MHWSRSITVVGCHAEGEVGRVITGGVLPPPGDSVFAQRTWLRDHGDELRQLLLYEPRGGAFTHYNLIVPPKTPGAAAGFIIMEPADYPPMSGSNAICVATVLLETGMLPMVEPETRLTLDAPGGPVAVRAICSGGRVERVAVTNLPSFVFALDVPIEVTGLGTLRADLAYGGDTFAIVDATALGFALARDEARDLVETGERIKAAVNDQHPVVHPENPAIDHTAFVQFAGPLARDEHARLTGRNSVVISPGKLDRSPCGTGSCARMAVLRARGELAAGEDFVSRSILDTAFHCRIEADTEVAGRPAIVPRLSGRAWITGIHTYGLDPEDPFPRGYTLSDTWYRAL